MSQIPAGWVKKMVGKQETYEPPKKCGSIKDVSCEKQLATTVAFAEDMQLQMGKAAATMPGSFAPPDWKEMTKQLNTLFVSEGSSVEHFIVPVEPMGAPRMTKRDKRKKRPVVLRYFAYRDAIRLAVGPVKDVPDRVDCEFYFPMPKSWSKRKMAKMAGMPHRSVPDCDNCFKSVADSLFKQDSGIHEASQIKRWCYAGQERVVIKLTTYKK